MTALAEAPLKRDPSPRLDSWKLSRSEPLAPDEAAVEMRRYKTEQDPAAARRIVESHMRLVASIAGRFCSPQVPLDDLMAEGALALYRALENFDPDRGASFTSYASVVVSFAIRGAAREHSHAMRIPGRERGRSAARGRADSLYFASHGHRPTSAELASSAAGPADAAPLSLGPCVSLDADLAAGGTRASTVPDAGPTPLEAVAGKEDARCISAALDTLPPHLAKVVRKRFGIGEEPCGLAGLAQSLRVTQSAVELMLLEGLRSLRQTLAPAAQARTAG